MRTKANDDGWEDVPETETGITFSESKNEYKLPDGRHVVESGMDYNTGKIGELKAKLGEFAKNEVKQFKFGHKWKVQKKIISEAGNKQCRVRVVEGDFDGKETPSEPTTPTNVGEVPNEPAGPSGLQVLKNAYDELKKDFRWACAIGGIGLAIALVGTAILYGKLIF